MMNMLKCPSDRPFFYFHPEIDFQSVSVQPSPGGKEHDFMNETGDAQAYKFSGDFYFRNFD